MLLAIGPFVDQAVSRRWILDYTWTLPAARQLLLSCALAVLVNISQFMCLGRFSAVTFQVGTPPEECRKLISRLCHTFVMQAMTRVGFPGWHAACWQEAEYCAAAV